MVDGLVCCYVGVMGTVIYGKVQQEEQKKKNKTMRRSETEGGRGGAGYSLTFEDCPCQ